MAERDLLNKPIPMPHSDADSVDTKNLPAAPALGKLGVRERAREIAAESAAGGLGRADQQPAEKKGKVGERQAQPQAKGAPTFEPVAPRAFEALYFNQDVKATAVVNQRARPMAALRGEEGATDLKKVVLPQPSSDQTPSPEEVESTLSLMGLNLPQGPNLDSLLRRQGSNTQRPGMTAEKIAAQLAQLEAMVATRVAALARLGQLAPHHLARSVTLAQAFLRQGEPDVPGEDLELQGDALVSKTAQPAEGMHKRLLKVLRSKI